MKTFVATKNLGKLAEMREIFAGSALELDTYPLYADVEESADDYVGNARLKATALAAQLREAGIAAAVLADDSGLEVAALDGRPGIYSARYAGVATSWPDRREALLAELRDVEPDRRGGRFVCSMVLLLPDGRELDGFGTVAGRMVEEVRGRFGFGYDPLFVPDGDTRTFAEFPEAEKNRVSHRRRAADALLAILANA
ncbi:MAG TPA: non-canonical purine NTP pyrophosphatase [Candidatus Baltobacteraceae bacterium]|jgi:XTP/dITP diphosphohydrolase